MTHRRPTPDMASLTGLVQSTLGPFTDGIVGAVPELAAGLVFPALAYLAIRPIRPLLGASLRSVSLCSWATPYSVP